MTRATIKRQIKRKIQNHFHASLHFTRQSQLSHTNSLFSPGFFVCSCTFSQFFLYNRTSTGSNTATLSMRTEKIQFDWMFHVEFPLVEAPPLLKSAKKVKWTVLCREWFASRFYVSYSNFTVSIHFSAVRLYCDCRKYYNFTILSNHALTVVPHHCRCMYQFMLHQSVRQTIGEVNKFENTYTVQYRSITMLTVVVAVIW